MPKQSDCVVIGAGVIGAAVARSLLVQKKVKSVVVLEKEDAPALHTSGRNSGVLHSGFNPKPGHLKARFCVEGNRRTKEFCKQKGIAFAEVGTLVVALEESERSGLQELHRRGVANGVDGIRLIEGDELRRHEPNALGIAALHAPTGAITSGKEVTRALVEDAKSMGAEFFFNERVSHIEKKANGYRVIGQQTYDCSLLINSAGLYADDVAHMLDVGRDYRIIPFRGEYFRLKTKKDLVRSMIYPMPDLNYPFLGVHWTKTIAGDLIIGPSATMAFGKESYKASSIGLVDSLKMVMTPNFWNLLRSKDFRRLAMSQMQMSLDSTRFIRESFKLVKGAEVGDFEPGKSGNRAQVVDRSGKLVDDILVEKSGTSIHVLNAVSPGFTCSLPFADYVVDSLFN